MTDLDHTGDPALAREALAATIALHDAVPWGAGSEAFREAVVRETPASMGVVDVEIEPGPAELHRSPYAVAATIPSRDPEQSVVLHLTAPSANADDLQLYATALARIARVKHVDGSAAPEDGTAFAQWLIERNSALEREIERVRNVARFLVETAQRQLDVNHPGE